MIRITTSAILGLAVFAAIVGAQEGIRKGTIKRVDVEKGIVTLTADGKDRELVVTDATRIMGASGGEVKGRLKDAGFKEGAEVFFKVEQKGGRSVLVGLKFAGGGKSPGLPQARVDTSGLKTLTELGRDEYHGFKGGLYPDGKSDRPVAHEAAGLALAKKVQPLDTEGKPDPKGKIVLLSVGMSNTTQEFSLFKQLADSDPDKNPKLVVVDGAQGGMSAGRIVDSEDNGSGTRFWTTVDQRLKAAGVARAQVQAAWIKQADPGPNQGFPRYAQTLEERLGKIVRLMHQRFPNLKLVYLSSRTYGGYARTPLNPEPYAYESAFSVKWLIERQLKGDKELNFNPDKGEVAAPWLSWGPYLWANGTTKRADGFSYDESDFGGDGTHPSQSGRKKVADLLLKFFKSDMTARAWFVGR